MERQNYITAINDADIILSRSDKMLDYRKKAIVGSKAAALLWKQDNEKARAAFLRFWQAIDKAPDGEQKPGISEKDEARIEILRELFPLDAEMAMKLHNEVNRSKEKEDPLHERLGGTTESARRLAFLSHRIAEHDPILAAQILRMGIEEANAPALLSTLNRIRSNDAILANSIVTLLIDEMSERSASFGLATISHMGEYLFPSRPSPANSIEEMRDDETLRNHYMQSGYEILKRSQDETDEFLIRTQGFDQRALRQRKLSQDFAAIALAAMSPRYMPEKMPELSIMSAAVVNSAHEIVRPLFAMRIAVIKSLIGELEDAEETIAAISAAIASEDYNKAETLIGDLKEESQRKLWLDMLYRDKTEALLKRKEGEEALEAARKIVSPPHANRVLPQILKFAHEDENETLMVRTFQEIKRVAGKTGKGQRALANFTLTAELAGIMKDQSEVMLIESVELINSLSAIDRDKDKSKEELTPVDIHWNDPDRFLNSSAMTRAFTALGRLDMNAALRVADRFNDNNLQMVARLSAMESTIKKGPPPEPEDEN